MNAPLGFIEWTMVVNLNYRWNVAVQRQARSSKRSMKKFVNTSVFILMYMCTNQVQYVTVMRKYYLWFQICNIVCLLNPITLDLGSGLITQNFWHYLEMAAVNQIEVPIKGKVLSLRLEKDQIDKAHKDKTIFPTTFQSLWF